MYQFTEKEAKLMNTITSYMQKEQMTVEELENICDKVKELFRTDAIIKG